MPGEVFYWLGLDARTAVDHLTGRPPHVRADLGVDVAPYAALWLTGPA